MRFSIELYGQYLYESVRIIDAITLFMLFVGLRWVWNAAKSINGVCAYILLYFMNSTCMSYAAFEILLGKALKTNVRPYYTVEGLQLRLSRNSGGWSCYFIETDPSCMGMMAFVIFQIFNIQLCFLFERSWKESYCIADENSNWWYMKS